MLLDDVADYLSSGGVGTVGTDIFKGYLPEQPDAAVAIYETGGMPALHTMGSTSGQAKLVRPSIQVVVRGTPRDGYTPARALAQKVWQLMDGMPERQINGIRYCWAQAKQEPFTLGRGENERPTIACNFDITKEVSTTS